MLQIVLFAYGAYCLAMYLGQQSILFPGKYRSAPEDPPAVPGMEVVWVPTSFGRVQAYYLAPARLADPDAKVPAVLFTHGNGELIDDWAFELARFRALGVAVLLVEFPGYGRSDGSPSLGRIRETVLGAFDMLVARPEVSPAHVVAMGRSIGSVGASILARERPITALIYASAFTSLRPLATSRLIPPFLIRDEMDNLTAVKSFPGPVLVLHGNQDEIIDFSHGQRLADAAAHGTLRSLPCGHNDFPGDWRAFWDEVDRFLRSSNLYEPERSKTPPGVPPQSDPQK